MSYTPPIGVCDASWVGAAEYHAPFSVVPGDWQGRIAIYPAGFAAGAVGTPPLVTKQQFAGPTGFNAYSGGDALQVTLDWQYIRPHGAVDASWVGADAYTPASGVVDARWSVGPPATDLYVYPVGVAPGDAGTPALTWNLFIGPAGVSTLRIGRPRVTSELVYSLDASWQGARPYTAPQGTLYASWQVVPEGTVVPYGFVATRWGFPGVCNGQNFVLPKGWDTFQGFGEHWVSLGTRRINAGLGDQAAYGRAELAGGTRWLDVAGRGIAASLYGRPTLWFHERRIEPAWFIATLYGQHMVDHHHGVESEGWDSSDFGRPEVHVPRDYVDLAGLGIAGPLWGEHVARNAIEYLRPNGIGPWPGEHERFGRPETQLWTRYIQQMFEVTPNDGGVFGNFNYVENRDKVPRPEGWVSSRFGAPEIYNNARIITTPPHQDMSLWGDTRVAYRIRHITPQGFEATQWGSPLGNIVYNAARVLAPEGFDASTIGTPERVWSNLQWMDHAGGDDHTEFGGTMVAFAIRTVAPYSLPEPPSAGYATVQNWERYIEPPGIDAGRYGVPTLEEHFTIVAPKSVLPPVNQVGDSNRVWNLTPELHQMGAVHTEWGRAAVFNEWEAYEMQGFRSTMWGRHTVRDRRSWIEPRSISVLAFGPRTEVRNVDPDPPGPQTLEARGWRSSDTGRPLLSGNVIYHKQLEAHTRFGAPAVVYMGISPVSIEPPYDPATGSQCGIPTIPQTQHLRPIGFGTSAAGKPHLWPHTIWAPRGYPYPGGEGDRGHIMDWALHGGRMERPVFGQVEVTHRDRAVRPIGIQPGSKFGEHRFSLNPQYLRMEGQRFQKFGIPVVWGGDQGVQFYGFDMALYGRPEIAHDETGPRRADVRGIAPGAFGVGRVEHFHREVAPRGFDSFQISPPKPPSWPRESHWISNAYPPFEIPGFDATLWGATWVSHYIRHLEPEGWDSAIVADYEPGHFKLRMRVRRDDYVRSVGAGEQGGFGAAGVTHGTRGVLVRAIYDGRLGHPSVRAVWAVAVPGWDSQVFGNIDRWEAGKVKARGDDLAAFGKAILHRALRPEPITGSVGTARVAHAINTAGSDTSDVPAPTLTAFVCGTRARAIPGFDALGMGIPQVGEQVAAALEPGEIRPAGWLATNQTLGTSFSGHAVHQTKAKTWEIEIA